MDFQEVGWRGRDWIDLVEHIAHIGDERSAGRVLVGRHE